MAKFQSFCPSRYFLSQQQGTLIKIIFTISKDFSRMLEPAWSLKMHRTNVNLTISVVEAEVETLLRSYPYHPYQQAFAAPRLRQKLIAYVLSRIPGLYAVIDEQEFSTEEPLHCPSEQHPQVETLIHRGIQYLLIKSLPKIASDTEAFEDMEAMNVGATSSHWLM